MDFICNTKYYTVLRLTPPKKSVVLNNRFQHKGSASIVYDLESIFPQECSSEGEFINLWFLTPWFVDGLPFYWCLFDTGRIESFQPTGFIRPKVKILKLIIYERDKNISHQKQIAIKIIYKKKFFMIAIKLALFF